MQLQPLSTPHVELVWTRRVRRVILSVMVGTWAGWVAAQNPEVSAWVELQTQPPASFSTAQLVEFQVSVHSELRYGLDPKTVTLGTDGVVRYVLVAQSQTAHNILYEGLRCATGEAKTYARWVSDHPGQWQPYGAAAWRPLSGNSASRPAQVLAREAFCEGKSPNGNVAKMLRELRYGKPAYR